MATVTLTITAIPAQGLVLHLEADSGVSTAGGAVTGWADQSAAANHLVTTGGAPQLILSPLNGQPVVRFDGNGDILERVGGLTGLPAGAGDRSIFVLVDYRSVGMGGFAYGKKGCNQTFGVVVNSTGRLTLQGWCTAFDFHSTTIGTGVGWLTQAVILAGNQWTHYADSAVIATGSNAFNTVLERIVLGAEIDRTPQVDMDVAAVLVYARALSEAERQHVENFLAAKYLEP